jgi:hypothetical protein
MSTQLTLFENPEERENREKLERRAEIFAGNPYGDKAPIISNAMSLDPKLWVNSKMASVEDFLEHGPFVILQEGKDSDFDVRARECGQYVSTPMLDVVLKSYLVSPPTYNSMSIMFDPVSSCIILYHPIFSSYIYI